MPVLQITTRQAVEWGANKLLDNQQISAERKRAIKPVTEFNLLTTAFNVSTILIVAAVAAAILFAYTAAFTLGAMGLFVRYATEKELNKYTLPYQPPLQEEQGAGAALWGRLREAFNTALLRHALHQTRPEEKITNIFLNLGLPRQEGWEPYHIVFDEFGIWREKIDIPPVEERGPAAAVPPAAPGVAPLPRAVHVENQPPAVAAAQPVLPAQRAGGAAAGVVGVAGGAWRGLVDRVMGAAAPVPAVPAHG